MPIKPKDFQSPQKKFTKEERKEYTRQRDLVNNVVMPILLKHSKSIRDCENILKSVVVGLDYKFQKRMKEYEAFLSGELLASLNLKEDMNDNINQKVDYIAERQIVDAFLNEKIGTFRGLLQGAGKVFEAAITKEMMDRKLESLNLKY